MRVCVVVRLAMTGTALGPEGRKLYLLAVEAIANGEQQSKHSRLPLV